MYQKTVYFCLCVAHCWFVAAASNACDQSDRLQRYAFAQQHMGTKIQLTLYAHSKVTASAAAMAAFERVRQLDKKLSDYNPKSELRKLGALSGTSELIPVSDDMWKILTTSKLLSQQTNGAFDVTVGPYVRLWRLARKTKTMPTSDRLQRAANSVGYKYMRLDAKNHTVVLARPNMRLDLGGIAKGFAADEALRILKTHRVNHAFVDAGGDLALGDAPPGKKGWRVGLSPFPKDIAGRKLAKEQYNRSTIILANCGIATSGDLFQFAEIAGTRYSHIVNPTTGLGITNILRVTVIAPNCTQADSYASAISVLGPIKGIPCADAQEGVAAMILQREAGGGIREFKSARYAEFFKQ